MDDFIERFIDYTSSFESPTHFFYWAAIAGVSAILRDNAYLPLGDTKMFPNVYILIIARPAMRKAKPLNSIVELCKHVDNTKIIEGRTSIQAVIQRLGEMERRKDGRTITGASGIIFSEEISAMFTEDDANIPVLTDLYDFKSSYTSALVSRGTTRLTNVVVTMLGASNEELLKPVFNNRAIYGGLLSRCLVVYGDKVRHRNSLVYEDPKKYDPEPLRLLFRKMASLRGFFKLTEAAKADYDEWYTNVCPKLEEYAGNTGAEGRVQTNVLKVAMILAVAKTQTLIVDACHIHDAISKVQSLFSGYRRLTLGSGKSKEAEPAVIVLKQLWGAPGYALARNKLLFHVWGDVSSDDLNGVIQTLSEAGFITIGEEPNTKQPLYKLTSASIEYIRGRM